MLTSPLALGVLFIRKLMTKLLLWPNTSPLIFDFISTRPPWWCYVHHPCCASTSLKARLGNPSPTCFLVKQTARSRCVSRVVFILPSVLWCNRQTIAHIVLRSKPRNCHGDFVVQITKLQQPVLRPNWEKPSILVLRLNQETRAPHLLVHSANRTQRLPTSRSSDHRVSDLCLTIPVLCTKSPTPISLLIAPRHAAPVTYTSRDKQTRFSTQKR
jgi:hypothetical protein